MQLNIGYYICMLCVYISIDSMCEIQAYVAEMSYKNEL